MNLSLLSLLDLKKNGSDSFTPVCIEGGPINGGRCHAVGVYSLL